MRHCPRVTAVASMRLTILIVLTSCAFVAASRSGFGAEPGLFARENLVAWCIVPFDAAKRGPEDRAAMLERLGIRQLAYDWRAEHVPTFDAEIEALKRHNIKLTAFWFPTGMSKEAQTILDLLRRHQVRTQLWVSGRGGPGGDPQQQAKAVRESADRIRPIAEAAGQIGCTVELYNHGGWFGEPENQIAIIERSTPDCNNSMAVVWRRT